MTELSRMPRYDIRNDGMGPYAVFYCEACDREHRSQPEVAATIAKDIGRKALGGLLRNVPGIGGALASSTAEDPRYTLTMTPQQLEKAWQQVSGRFRECPTCQRIVCLSCFDEQSGYCNDDTPRRAEIAEAQGEQAGAALKGIASAFGLGEAFKQVSTAVKQASTNVARCPNDGTTAPAGTKFCPECGSAMTQPVVDACPNCGKETHGAKFCPECGTKIERQPAGICPNCGTETKGAKFCPECGTKMA
jgi:ribosomal protein L32